MDLSDQHLIELLLIGRGIDDLDGKNDSEIFAEYSGKCKWHSGECLLLVQILDQFKGQCKIM